MMHLRIYFSLCVAIASSTIDTDVEAKKVWSFSPDKGFVDDVMSFSSTRFAYIHTDAAQFLHLVVFDISSKKQLNKITLAEPRRVPKKLTFTPDGTRLILLWMDGYSGKRGAMLFDATAGKLLKTAGGKSHYAAVTVYANQQVVVLGDERSDKRGNQRLSLQVYRASDLRRMKSARLSINADQTIKRPELRLLYFEPGKLSVVGMKRGSYDKKRDIRLPERAVRYHLLARKELWSKAPDKLVPWTMAINMRPKHAGQYRFLQVSDDLKKLHYVDLNNNLGEVKTPVPWKLYEKKSLKQKESWDGNTLYFSMTVDPVNPDAVARKKADKERADIYRLDPGLVAHPIGKVLTGKRRFTWEVGETHFAYLRKLKGFGRGGKTLELYTYR